MLASFPASILNQTRGPLGIPTDSIRSQLTLDDDDFHPRHGLLAPGLVGGSAGGAAQITSTSQRSWCMPPSGFVLRIPAIVKFSPLDSSNYILELLRSTKMVVTSLSGCGTSEDILLPSTPQ